MLAAMHRGRRRNRIIEAMCINSTATAALTPMGAFRLSLPIGYSDERHIWDSKALAVPILGRVKAASAR